MLAGNPNNKGFSLIELIIYIAILIIIVSTVFSFLFWVIRVNKKINSSQELLSGVQRALNILNRDISSAADIYTPTSSSTQLSLITNYNTPSGEEITFIDFFQCGDSLCRKREGQNPEKIMPESITLTSLNFTLIATSSTPAVKLDISAACDIGGSQNYSSAKIDISTSIALRAY
ncbi:MAG: prepilin-type N-terminal cleavage/methylation domain-containing protein [Patescibacteria group bacterium]|nr:prepilin-type N-terminal cleavage/methylation domain-containing protein [Patescibacteria group bacterium]